MENLFVLVKKNWLDINAALTKYDLLVIFIGLLAILTGRLWFVTKKYTRLLQRAYIVVEPLGIHMNPRGTDLVGHVGIKNAGKLPARRLSWLININVSESREESNEFFPIAHGKGNIVIAPGATATHSSVKHVGLPVPNDEPASNPKELFLYVWGAVTYHDGFTRKRTTKFCHRYDWLNRGKWRSAVYEIAAEFGRYHEYGNDAD